jgi:hypothetical protein
VKQIAVLGSAFSLVVAVTGCGNSNDSSQSTPATANDYDDVAQALGSVVVTSGGGGEVGSFADAADLSVGLLPLGVTLSANGAFAGNRVGLNYDYKLTCTSASGAKLPACDSTTDTAAVSVDWSGNLVVPNFSASVMRQGDWSLSGLQTDTAAFAGTSTFSFDAQFQSAFRPAMVAFHLDYDAQYSGIVMERLLHHVTGGAIHYSVKAERTATNDTKVANAMLDMTADLTFSTAGAATLTLDGSHTYSVDTASGQVARTSQ